MVGAIPDSHGNLTVKALRLDITLPKKQIRAAHTYCSDGIFRTHKRFNRKQCHRMKYPDSASPLPPPSQLPSGILEVALRYSCRYSLWIAHSSFIPMLIFTFTGDCPCGVNITQCALFFNAFFVFCKKSSNPLGALPSGLPSYIQVFQKKDCCYFAFVQVLLAYLHCLSAVFATSLPFSS